MTTHVTNKDTWVLPAYMPIYGIYQLHIIPLKYVSKFAENRANIDTLANIFIQFGVSVLYRRGVDEP